MFEHTREPSVSAGVARRTPPETIREIAALRRDEHPAVRREGERGGRADGRDERVREPGGQRRAGGGGGEGSPEKEGERAGHAHR